MTEEIKYNKDEKWIPYKQLEETPQQTIARLEQENKELKILAKSLYKKIEGLGKENEALAFRERLYKADYEASEQENKELERKAFLAEQNVQTTASTFCEKDNKIKELEQENKELKKQHYEALKMLKHEYDGRQRDNEQWFTRCTENHNEDSKIIEKYRSALEEIKGIVTGNYEILDPQAKQDIQNKINEVLK